ncbi:hypothetical protein [Aeromicrobium sp. UC242_57]|uniref:hypothetical protein n=1 Tax=Aeromicrobium sp. UC242_57 TaxID=3374624 RepID=UPI00379EC4AA
MLAPQNPRLVTGEGAVTTLTLANNGWVLRGGALAPDGTLYLQDASVVPTRVVKIAPDGAESVVATLDFPAAGQLAPTSGDIAILPDGDLVVSAYRSPNTRFIRVDPDTGTTTTLFTLTNGESAARTGTDASGNFYYFTTLTSPKQVWKMNPTVGATPSLVGGTGTFGYDMNVDGVGNVYVAGGVGVSQANHGEISKFTLQGDGSYSAAALWASTPTVGQGGYSADGGITATPNGQVVLARSDGAGNASLYRYSAAGALTSTQAVTSVYPQVIAALPSSNPFTNAVDASVSGTVKVGEPLTGSAGTYAPSDASIAYAWKVGSDTVGTTSSYTPKLADAGKSLTLTVTGTKAGYAPSTSTTTGQTVATVQGFTGTVQAGQTLTASDASGTSTWGLSASSSCTSPTTSTGTTYELPSNSTGKYVQLSQTLSGRTGAGTCVGPIAAATSAPTITGEAGAHGVKGQAFSYTPESLTGQPAPTVTVVGTLPTGVSVNSSTGKLSGTPSVAGTFPVTLRADNGIGSAATLAVTITIDDVVTGLSPTIVGTPKVGVLLTVMPGTSLSPSPGDASVTAVWQYESSSGNWSDLTTGPTYTPGASEVGRVFRAKVTVSKAGFQSRTEYSPATSATVKGTFTIGAPSISGTAKVGQTLTCAAAGGTPGTLSYAWTRGGTALGSGASYVLLPADRTHEVTCTVTSTRPGYDDASNSKDSATVDYGTFTIGTPSISGTAKVGESLTCEAAGGTPGTLSYAWTRGAVSLGSGDTYELVVADLGEQVTCTVTASRPGYIDASASKDSTTIGSGTFSIAAPSVSGTAKVGQTLTCEAASGTPGTLSYAWTRGVTPVGSGDSYVLVAADRTEQVTCTVTAARTGYADASASKDSATVGYGSFTIDAPSISGTAAVGKTLTCEAAAGTAGDVSYAWTRGTTPLGSDAAYVLVAADRTEQVTCTVTSQRAGYEDASASKDSATVGYGTFSIDAPSLSGTAAVGKTLTCVAADGTPGDVSYAWTRGTTPLDTGDSYELVAADRAGQVTCTVTSQRAGYTDASASKDSATVAAGTFTIDEPSISGTAVVGQTLTCEAADDTPGTLSYAWKRGVTPVETGASYVLVAADRGEQVTCVVTAARAGYDDASAAKDSAVVGYGTFSIDTPSISGDAAVGKTLTCEAATGTPGTISYAWTRGVTPLGAGASHVLSADDRTNEVTCTVTAAREGYTDATAGVTRPRSTTAPSPLVSRRSVGRRRWVVR